MRTISNNEFNEALENQDYLRVLEAVSRRFRKKLSKNSRKQCCAIALWRALSRFDGRSKFTTFLHILATQQHYKETLKLSVSEPLPEMMSYDIDDKLRVIEIMTSLSEKDSKLLKERFFDRKTYAELSSEYGISIPGVAGRIEKIFETVRNFDAISL